MSAAGLGVTLWMALRWLAEPLSGTTLERTGTLALLVAGGIVLYAAVAHFTGAARLSTLSESLRSNKE